MYKCCCPSIFNIVIQYPSALCSLLLILRVFFGIFSLENRNSFVLVESSLASHSAINWHHHLNKNLVVIVRSRVFVFSFLEFLYSILVHNIFCTSIKNFNGESDKDSLPSNCCEGLFELICVKARWKGLFCVNQIHSSSFYKYEIKIQKIIAL